jgi:hypothetical protein
MITRRTFINGVAVSAAGAIVANTAKSYSQILGANERVNFAVVGLNGRGRAHLSALANNKDTARFYRGAEDVGLRADGTRRLPQGARR